MRTLLSQFCEEFDSAVRPVLEPLRRASEGFAENPERIDSRALLPTLLDLTHQFEVLTDKVAEQQAYVLIFGPLKSGKSTLMNAMSAAYVSEVTSLPAYPCMVYVSHDEKRGFEVTRYNGDKESFHDPAALRMQVSRAHTELAEHIRKQEAAGSAFDPAVHFPDAIRRVDVRVPAEELRQSGSVLVDTPGLYSRMKFGYDRMTREFRDAAACAIFVVKTDNLFLEQVFDEFSRLLELFSRIFLVVNLDSSKRDLNADGTLVPSLESEDPIRIVEAFENLSMSAPLKAAAEEGRLRIYPVDLQRAASRRLASDGDPLHAAVAPGFTTEGQADFEGFMSDLTEYLNSTDYLVAFLGDSLRRAGSLLTEVDQTCKHQRVQAMSDELSALEDGERRARTRLAALARLGEFDWSSCLGELETELGEVGRQAAESVAGQSGESLSAALDRWFQSDASLHSLLDAELRPLLEGGQRDLALRVHEALAQHVSRGVAAVRLPASVAEDMAAADIRFGEFGRLGLDSVDPVAGVRVGVPPLYPEEIPVQRTIWDLLLFRSKARIRRKVFGREGKPDQRIPREVKAKRLGAPARQSMDAKLREFHGRQLPKLLDRLAARIFEDYRGALTSSLEERIRKSVESSKRDLARTHEEIREYRRILNRILDLSVRVEASEKAVAALDARYSKTDPSELKSPVPTSSAATALDVKELIPHTPAESEQPTQGEAPAEEEIRLE